MNLSDKKNIIKCIKTILEEKKDLSSQELILKVVQESKYTNQNKIRQILRSFNDLFWFSTRLNKKQVIYSLTKKEISLKIIQSDKTIYNKILKNFQDCFVEEYILTKTEIKKKMRINLKREFPKFKLDNEEYNKIINFFIENHTIVSSINSKRLLFIAEK